MCCGVRFGLSLGELLDWSECMELVELGLFMTCDHGFFVFVFVGVALRLAEEETDEEVGEDGPREYQVGSSCKFTMDMVCDS